MTAGDQRYVAASLQGGVLPERPGDPLFAVRVFALAPELAILGPELDEDLVDAVVDTADELDATRHLVHRDSLPLRQSHVAGSGSRSRMPLVTLHLSPNRSH